MKFFTLLTGAVAAITAAAAPTKDLAPRASIIDLNTLNQLNGKGAFNLGAVNGFQFANADIGYLFGLQGFDINLIANLAAAQNLQLLTIQNLAFAQTLDIGSLLALAELKTLTNLAQVGVLSAFDLATLQLHGSNILGFGVLGNAFSGINLGSFVDPAILNQAHNIALTQCK
jgi:hypothetical protein